MMQAPEIWIRLKPLPSAVSIDQQKQAALQFAHKILTDLGLNVRNGEMTDWSVNLGQPSDWPQIPIDSNTQICWEPLGVVLTESAVRKASAHRVDVCAAKLGAAAQMLLGAGLQVVVHSPGAKYNIRAVDELLAWVDFIINPRSRRASQRCRLGAEE